jgi:hypothetical protein
MEHLSQQQYVTVEGIDNSNARALVVKLINVVLTVLQVVLLLTATAAGIIMPFLKTRSVHHLACLGVNFQLSVLFCLPFQGPRAHDSRICVIHHIYRKDLAGSARNGDSSIS